MTEDRTRQREGQPVTRQVRRRALRIIRKGGRVEVESAAQALGLLEALHGAGELLVHMLVMHGPSCNAARCVCEPTYAIERLTEETMLEGARAQERWMRETATGEA